MIILPLRPLPDDTTNFVIDKVVYKINNQWNSREQAWYINIYRVDDSPAILGEKLLQSRNLTHRHGLPDFIDGDIYVINANVNQERPKFEDLGSSLQLVWLTNSESADIRNIESAIQQVIYT